MTEPKMIDYGNVYEAILADNRQMRQRIAELERTMPMDEDAFDDMIHKAATEPVSIPIKQQGDVWEPVDYDHLFTKEGKPIRPDYKNICEDWYEFNNQSHDTKDGYEFTICRRTTSALQRPVGSGEA